MRYIVNNQEILKKQRVSKNDVGRYYDIATINFNNQIDDEAYDAVRLDGNVEAYSYNKLGDVIRDRKNRSSNYKSYKKYEDVFLNDITSQIFNETYRIIKGEQKEKTFKNISDEYYTNDKYTNDIIEIVGNENEKYLDLIRNKANPEIKYSSSQNFNNQQETTIAPPIIQDVETQQPLVSTQENNQPQQKYSLDELNKILPDEYDRLKKEISDYQNNYAQNLLVAGSSPIGISDAINVNLYKKWYLTKDELFEGKRQQDKKMNDLISQYEAMLQREKIADAQKEIEAFQKSFDLETKVANQQNEVITKEINDISKSNSLVQTKNTQLRSEIKSLQEQLKANREKQRIADSVRRSLVDKVMGQNQQFNNKDLFNQSNDNQNNQISLSTVKENAIHMANINKNNLQEHLDKIKMFEGSQSLQNAVKTPNNQVENPTELENQIQPKQQAVDNFQPEDIYNSRRKQQISENTLSGIKSSFGNQQTITGAINNPNQQLSNRQMVINNFKTRDDQYTPLNSALNQKRNNLFQSFGDQKNSGMNVDLNTKQIIINNPVKEEKAISLADALNKRK